MTEKVGRLASTLEWVVERLGASCVDGPWKTVTFPRLVLDAVGCSSSFCVYTAGRLPGLGLGLFQGSPLALACGSLTSEDPMTSPAWSFGPLKT